MALEEADVIVEIARLGDGALAGERRVEHDEQRIVHAQAGCLRARGGEEEHAGRCHYAANDKQQLEPMLAKTGALPEELGRAETMLVESRCGAAVVG